MSLGLRTMVLSRLGAVRTRVPAGLALTFDDGPMPGTTDRVLDTLAELGVRGTFFCVGRNASRHPRLLRRMHDEGHSVGSHSMSHAPAGSQSEKDLRTDFVNGRHAVEQALGHPVPLFRPPYGRLTAGTARFLRSCDSWTWSVDPMDWAATATSTGLSKALAAVDEGDVVLLHDWVEPQVRQSLDRSPTMSAVQDVVLRMQARGIPLVTLADG